MVQSSIRVAIIGGGLAGTVLMNTLLEYPHLDVHLYEGNTEFKERGASVGLATNGLRALSLMGLRDIVKRARGVNVAGARVVIGEGPDAGKKVFDYDLELTTVHRAALLNELVTPLPKDRLHFGKKLKSIETNTVYFEDGSTTNADLIIGADGIHSAVRKFLFGEGHTAVNPVFAGFWDCRTVMSLKQAVAAFGTTRIDLENPRQHIYCGERGLIFHDIIDDGETVCVIAAGKAPDGWDKTQWKQSISREEMNTLFRGWDQVAQPALDLIFGDKTETSTFVEWESAKAPSLYGSGLCVIGDAAHATTPWQGSGLALAIEDSLILKSVLGRCENVNDLPIALKAYDQLMRPRGQRIIESSRGTGMICLGSEGLDAEHLAKILPPRWDFILYWDTEKAIQEALEIFDQNRVIR